MVANIKRTLPIRRLQKCISATHSGYLLKADELDSLKKFRILSENVIFHE